MSASYQFLFWFHIRILGRIWRLFLMSIISKNLTLHLSVNLPGHFVKNIEQFMFPSCFVKASYMTPKEAAELFFTIGRPDKLNNGCFGSDLRVLIWYNYKWKSECYFGFNTSKYFCAGACMSASIKKTTRTKVCVFGGEVIVRCFNTWQTKLSIFERKRKWRKRA